MPLYWSCRGNFLPGVVVAGIFDLLAEPVAEKNRWAFLWGFSAVAFGSAVGSTDPHWFLICATADPPDAFAATLKLGEGAPLDHKTNLAALHGGYPVPYTPLEREDSSSGEGEPDEEEPAPKKQKVDENPPLHRATTSCRKEPKPRKPRAKKGETKETKEKPEGGKAENKPKEGQKKTPVKGQTKTPPKAKQDKQESPPPPSAGPNAPFKPPRSLGQATGPPPPAVVEGQPTDLMPLLTQLSQTLESASVTEQKE